MKDINEQIERIKQLFTEERLHGNLVDSKENIDEQDMYKRGRKAIEKEAKAREKRDSFRSTKEKGDNETKYQEELLRIEKFYKKDRRAFKNKYEYKDTENNKLFPHKDGVGDGARIKLIKFATKDGSLEERIEAAKKLLKEYLEKKKGIKKYKITQLHPKPKDKVKDPEDEVKDSKYVVFSYVPEAVVASSEDNTGKQDTGKQDDVKQVSGDDKQGTDKQDDVKQASGDDKQGDGQQSSEPLQDELGIQIISNNAPTYEDNFYTDEKLSELKNILKIKSITATKVDKDKKEVTIADENGDGIVLKLKESITKKHLLESVYTNSVILEQQFVDKDGKEVDLGELGDELKALFNDNDPTQDADPTQDPADPKEEEWKKYPCVVNNTDRESRTDEGDYIIGDKIYHSDGSYTLNGEREGNTYSCKKGKIVHDFDIKNERKKKEEEERKKLYAPWEKFPCVYKNPKKKENIDKNNGTISYIINGNRFFNNGRVSYQGKTYDYYCKGEKIIIPNKMSWAEYSTTFKDEAQEIINDFNSDDYSDAIEDLSDLMSSTNAEELNLLEKLVIKYRDKKLLPIFNQAYVLEVSKGYGNTFYEDVKDVDCVLDACSKIQNRIVKMLEDQGVKE